MGDEGEGDPLELIRAENAELKSRLEKLEKPEEEEAPVYKEPTEEEWAKHEEQTGLSRQALKFQAGREAALVNRFEKMLEQKFGKFEKQNAIAALSRAVIDGKRPFADITKYSKGMDEVLADFDPSSHSNEKILRMAYYAAKGKGSGGEIKKILNKKELNRKILKKGVSHVAPKGKGGGVKLNAEQRQAADDADMSYEEYAKWMNPTAGIE